MTIAELIKELSDEDPERLVVLARDSEGNGYSPVAGIWSGVYVPDSSYSGEMSLGTLDDEAIAQGYTEEDVADPTAGDNVLALCLCPTN